MMLKRFFTFAILSNSFGLLYLIYFWFHWCYSRLWAFTSIYSFFLQALVSVVIVSLRDSPSSFFSFFSSGRKLLITHILILLFFLHQSFVVLSSWRDSVTFSCLILYSSFEAFLILACIFSYGLGFAFPIFAY